MIALDTNILARLLLADDAAQCARAQALLARSDVYTAPITVMIELVWVLESNDRNRDEIGRALGLLLSLANFRSAHADEVRAALQWYGEGMDFSDALHLALHSSAIAASLSLVTFDKKFVKVAKRLKTPVAVSEID